MQDNLRQYDEDDYEPPVRGPKWFNYLAGYMAAFALSMICFAVLSLPFAELFDKGWMGLMANCAILGFASGLTWGWIFAAANRKKLKFVIPVAALYYLAWNVPLTCFAAWNRTEATPTEEPFSYAVALVPNAILFWGFFLTLAIEGRQELDKEKASPGDAA